MSKIEHACQACLLVNLNCINFGEIKSCCNKQTTKFRNCCSSLLFVSREVSEPVHIQFLETMSSVTKLMSHLSHDARGHVIQTVSHVEIFLLLVQCQKSWIQSKVPANGLQEMMSLLKIDLSKVLKKSSNLKTPKVPEVTVQNPEDINDTAPETSSSTKETKPKCQLQDLLLKIIMDWKSHSNQSDSMETCIIDLLLLMWVLDQLNAVDELDIDLVAGQVALVERKIVESQNGNIISNVVCKGGNGFSEVLSNLVNLYSIVGQRFLENKDKESFDREQVVASLNKMMVKMIADRLDGKTRDKMVKVGQKGSVDVASIEIRKLYMQSMMA